MAEMVGSAVVQEVVSGAFSFMRNSHEEMAAQSHLIERLKWANWNLELALQRTKRMPIMEVPLLKLRRMIKHAFEESRDLLDKQHTQLVNLEDEGAQEGVTLPVSLPNRIMHAVKPFFGTEKGSISGSCVKRFEWFAEKTEKFVRDVESGYSLAPYRFSCLLVTQLLDDKCLHYWMVSGSQTRTLQLHPCFLEDYGAVAYLRFLFIHHETHIKTFRLDLMLRLSESTDIVGISTKCLQSLEPQFKPVADVASGELAQISTQVSSSRPGPAHREFMFNMISKHIRCFREEPLCCIGDGFQPSAKNMLSSELSERFPEQVNHFAFQCFISAAEYNLQSSTVETKRNTIETSPILHLMVFFLPHMLMHFLDGKIYTLLLTEPGAVFVTIDCLNLSEMAKFVQVQAVDCFKLEPRQTGYAVLSYSAHGFASFFVRKEPCGMGCAPKIGGGSKTRRASKRKR